MTTTTATTTTATATMTDDPRCGTYAGAVRHAKRGESCCLPCKKARNAYQRAYRNAGRDMALRGQGYGTTCVRGLGWPR